MILRRRQDPPRVPESGSAAAKAAYDAVAYPGYAFPQSHPGKLAAQATIFGLDPAPVETARILELGCGDGGNLIPIAYELPEATCVGVDLSTPALARGREGAAALGIANVDLIEGDLAALDTRALGKFDYVVAHGVYSWVPPAARDGLLAACRDCLRGDGVAFVSYNAQPGGHIRAIARDLLLRTTANVADPQAKLARAREALAVAGGAMVASPYYREAIQKHFNDLLERSDGSLFHDDLADLNEALYFTDFVAHAERHDLRYLSEPDLFETSFANHSPEVVAALDELAGDDEMQREQQLDFLLLRMFRQTLLCRREAKRAAAPSARNVHRLHATAALAPAKPSASLDDRSQLTFTGTGTAGATLTTDHPDVKRALAALAAASPASLPVADLLGHEPAAVRQALLGTLAANVVQFTTHAPPIAGEPGERPTASPMARRQVEAGEPAVTSLRHQRVELGDDLARDLLLLLDGTRDRAALAAAMRERGAGRDAERQLEKNLDRLVQLALLVRAS